MDGVSTAIGSAGSELFRLEQQSRLSASPGEIERGVDVWPLVDRRL